MKPRVKDLVDEIEKRTSLFYEKEDEEGNLVPDGLYTIQELIEELKRLEKNRRLAIQALRKKVKQEVIKGNMIELPAVIKDKVIEGDLYMLGENQIVTNCMFKYNSRPVY